MKNNTILPDLIQNFDSPEEPVLSRRALDCNCQDIQRLLSYIQSNYTPNHSVV